MTPLRANTHPSKQFDPAVRLPCGPSQTPFQNALTSLESQGKRSRLPNGSPICCSARPCRIHRTAAATKGRSPVAAELPSLSEAKAFTLAVR